MKLEQANAMTLQEQFDYSVNNLVKQGGQCRRQHEQGFCAYGNKKGRHCGIGWLLDENEKELMEFDGGVLDLIDQYRDYVPNNLLIYVNEFDMLQKFHDTPAKSEREIQRKSLQLQGIDTETSENWQKWIDMGTDTSKYLEFSTENKS